MDVANVNISKLYGIVSAAGEKQVLNVSEDEKGLSLSDGGAELTPEQIEANRKFHQGLLESLQGITGDKAVLDEVRSKLGLSQGGAKAESILARDIKSVIDLVMSKVSKRIDEVLTQRKFPDVVNKLILEAVKANPKHDVVTAFLQEGGGTLDNLARLCRLTCQSLKGGANSAALAYLDGFAYSVADFENVERVSVGDSQQYEAGVSHYEEEKKALAEKGKPKEQPSAPKEQTSVKNELQKVKDGFLFGGKGQKPGEKKVALNLEEIKEVDEEENADGKPPVQARQPSEEMKGLREEVVRLLGMREVEGDLLNFIENHCEDCLTFYKATCPSFGGVNWELLPDNERLSILAREISKKWKNAGRPQHPGNIPGEALKDALEKCERLVRFRTAVEDVKDRLEAEKNGLNVLPELARNAKLAFLEEIEGLKSLEAGNEVYQLMSIRLTNAKDLEKKDGNELREALRQTLEDILQRGDKLFDVNRLRQNAPNARLTTVEKDGPGLDGQTKILQGNGTNLCYLRSIENGLLANGNAGRLPKPDVNGTYTFLVDVGDTKVDKAALTVTKDEIAKLKKWYDINLARHKSDMGLVGKLSWDGSGQVTYNAKTRMYEKYSFYESQKSSFSDLDWAINLALAKRAMWKDAQNDMKTRGTVAAPKPLALIREFVGKTELVGGYAGKSYQTYLEERLITSAAKDTEVAEFFGLTEDDNVSVNHALEMGTSGKVEEPAKEILFKQWNRVRKWKEENPNGILTLNESNRHFVSVQDFYYRSETDFGFIVRDSNKAGGETEVKIQGYTYEGKPEKGLCHTLHIHCFKQGS